MARSAVKYVEKLSIKERRNWATGQPKLGNAQRLRGIVCIDPTTWSFKDTMKKWTKKRWTCYWNPPCPDKLPLNKRKPSAHNTFLENQDTLVSLKPTSLREHALGQLRTQHFMYLRTRTFFLVCVGQELTGLKLFFVSLTKAIFILHVS